MSRKCAQCGAELARNNQTGLCEMCIRGKCTICGAVLARGCKSAVCYNCRKAMETCEICPKYNECEIHNQTHKEKCSVCGKQDNCMVLRGGLCLDCYAKKWNKEHPALWLWQAERKDAENRRRKK